MRKGFLLSLFLLCSLIIIWFLPTQSVGQVVILSWNRSPDQDISHYCIHRDNHRNASLEIAQVPASESRYIDRNIEFGKTYYYRITCVDSAGNISEFSDEVSIKTGKNKKFDLEPSYPNPFNPETKFTFYVAEKKKVSLTIYDIRGRTVKTLTNEIKYPGHYRVTWDGKDNSGHQVASGVYFIQMKAGSFSRVRRIVVQK